MKILTSAQLTGYRRLKDKSVSMTFITSEKSSHEIMEIDKALDSFGILMYKGENQLTEEEVEELDNIDLDLHDNRKTQSQRLRNVLYMLWKQQGEKGEFKDFYKTKTEMIITQIKNKLE